MHTQLAVIWSSQQSLGSKVSDDRLNDWFGKYLGVGSGGDPVWLKTILKYRRLERDRVFTEILAKLRPDYNEDKDTLLEHMRSTPGGAIAESIGAE